MAKEEGGSEVGSVEVVMVEVREGAARGGSTNTAHKHPLRLSGDVRVWTSTGVPCSVLLAVALSEGHLELGFRRDRVVGA